MNDAILPQFKLKKWQQKSGKWIPYFSNSVKHVREKMPDAKSIRRFFYSLPADDSPLNLIILLDERFFFPLALLQKGIRGCFWKSHFCGIFLGFFEIVNPSNFVQDQSNFSRNKRLLRLDIYFIKLHLLTLKFTFLHIKNVCIFELLELAGPKTCDLDHCAIAINSAGSWCRQKHDQYL